jgi:NAD(P)-dependent dehydrogenase (short-subunit alcohol dehydrogenase family)
MILNEIGLYRLIDKRFQLLKKLDASMSFLPWLTPLNPPMADWSGRVVWLVGASTGIGAATAAALHARGAQVVVSARGEAALQALCQRHPGMQALALDVTRPEQAHTAVSQLLATHARLDLVLYCAGHYRPMSVADFDVAEHQRHLAVNYQGALHVLAAVLPVLRAQGHGHLSLVSSVAGFRGLPQSLAYGPTKAALTHLAEGLYLDLQPCGVGVSVIHPGFVQTPLTAQNSFAMPALITPEQAATAMLRGWAKGAFELHFPRRFTCWMQLLRVLPHRLAFAAIRRMTQSTTPVAHPVGRSQP